MAKPTTDTSQLQVYLDAGFQLIPLHRFDHFDERKGKKRERGKSPIAKDWTNRAYNSKKQIEHMEKGSNVGVRLRASDLVIDVDPRAFPEGETLSTDNPFRRICADVGLVIEDYPTVETGSGGLHLYMHKPEDVSVRDSLPEYPGVEFKSSGRQVVSAGSIHPTTKRTYEWDFLTPELDDTLGDAPKHLLSIIKRPAKSVATGGGEHSQEELAIMLDALDPEDFRQHDEWLTLMQACHHATAGDGRAEFVEWSTRDPSYSDEGGLIGRRWDSLHSDNKGTGGRVTYRTLHKILRDHKAEETIPRPAAIDDFETVGPEDLPKGVSSEPVEKHERKGPLEKMNDKYIAVMEGSQFRIFWEELDPETADPEKGIKPRKRWIRAKVTDFKQMLSNKRVQAGEKTIPIADAWLEWGGRRTANGVIFDPERDHEGFLNLWTGWGIEPIKKEGGWSMFEDLLRNTLCAGDPDIYDYVLNWVAHFVQHPGVPAEVAICFQGNKGTGKSTFGRALVGLAGKHGMHITSSEHLTGRFNSHLQDVVLMFADEAVKQHDQEAESRLKGIITEPTLTYEGKGRDAIVGRNRLHVVMASNSDWFVPMGLDGERRFLLQRVLNNRIGHNDWFTRLNMQLANGGLSAFLWDMLARDIEGWSPRDEIPATMASVEQKLRNLTPVAQWWYNILQEGDLPVEALHDAKWADDAVQLFTSEVRESFDEHCRMNGIRSAGGSSRSVSTMFAGEIKKLVPTLRKVKGIVTDDRISVKAHGDGRAWCYEFPPVEECREHMAQLLGAPIRWDSEDV